MFIEINNLIDVNQTTKLNGWSIGLSESRNDGSFLIHHFLSYSLKNSSPVCFVAFGQSFGHYNSVSLKFGSNLTTQRETSNLVFIEGLKLLGSMYLSDCDKGDNPWNNSDTKAIITNLLSTIKTAYTELQAKNVSSPTIIIDNISVLISLGFKFTDVIGLCHYLNELIHSSDNKGCVVIYSNNGHDDEDEQLKTLWNWLCHTCTTTIEVLGLSSGYCKDVHGEILVKHRKTLTKAGKEKIMQYKLTDKSITLFAAGMSSAVL